MAVESPLFRCVALCAEFPNDNPLLYAPLLYGREGGEPEREPEPVVESAVEVEPLTTAEPVAEPDVVAEVVADPVAEGEPDAAMESGTDPTPPVLEADDATDDIELERPLEEIANEGEGPFEEIEIVDDLVIEGAVEEVPSVPPPAPPADDPFDALVAVLEDVARAAGAPDAAMHTLRVLLGRERMGTDAPAEHSRLRTAAGAWQSILRGESEDFSACGASTLDEWSSIVVASALGEPARVESLRRELRSRGVAAFGLVVEAA
jgi:hypothetical protein